MTRLNLKPITTESVPTSHIEVGKSKLNANTRVVRVEHRGTPAFFYVEPVDDRVVNEIGNHVRVHPNVGALFGGIEHHLDFTIDLDASLADVPACKSVKLHTTESHAKVGKFLRENDYLLHQMDEVIASGTGQATVCVADFEPTGYTTVRVNEDTDIEFVDTGEFRELQSSRDASGRHGSGASGDGSNEEEVSVDLTPKKPTTNFADDVAGLEEIKRTAETLLALFDHETRSEVERRYGAGFAGRGSSMLLYGPPGCGKTLVSEAIAYEAKYNTSIEDEYGEVKFLEVKGSDVLSKYSGESEKRVESVFERAHGIAQDGFAVLFFDEVETLIPDRSDDSLQRHERSLTNAFLQEMNDIEDNLLVIGATNMPFTIDPAATRRFPIQQFIPQPDERVMAEVWRKHLSALPNTGEIDFDRLGEASVGYTPAEIADRILGSDLQRELVESVVADEPIEPDTEYLLARLNETEPKTIRQYVTSVREQATELEGYPEMRRYVEEQADRLGITLGGGNGGLAELLAAADEEGDEQ